MPGRCRTRNSRICSCGRPDQEREQIDEKWHRLELTHNQLSSYFVGLDAITRTRDAMRAKLGARYDLRRFNQALLEIGSVEPRFVEPLVARKLGVK